MQLHPLTRNDKPIFDRYVQQTYPRLSSYAFAPLYIWQEHFAFYWGQLSGHLCIFAEQNDDYFMPILPMPYEVSDSGYSAEFCSSVGGISKSRQYRCLTRSPRLVNDFGLAENLRLNDPISYLNVVRKAYQFMLESSRNPHIARIENVPIEMLRFFEEQGFSATLKETEYLYETETLSMLSGNRYKSKRNAYNAFIERYPSMKLSPYCRLDQKACFSLYEAWRIARAAQCDDEIYRAMLENSQSVHQIAITHADALGLLGRVVRINGEIKAYTFGYPLNPDTFCVLLEVADLDTKGLAQFIYREFCRELMGTYKWINAMDDSGLENIRRVKHSYHPTCLIPSYNIIRR